VLVLVSEGKCTLPLRITGVDVVDCEGMYGAYVLAGGGALFRVVSFTNLFFGIMTGTRGAGLGSDDALTARTTVFKAGTIFGLFADALEAAIDPPAAAPVMRKGGTEDNSAAPVKYALIGGISPEESHCKDTSYIPSVGRNRVTIPVPSNVTTGLPAANLAVNFSNRTDPQPALYCP
jgi:hypothetical protein